MGDSTGGCGPSAPFTSFIAGRAPLGAADAATPRRARAGRGAPCADRLT